MRQVCYLWRLNISAVHQGRGYGRFAVCELCEEALRRGQHRVTVSYSPHENGPGAFYRRLGFRPTGEQNHGEAVAELILPDDRAASPVSGGERQ